MDLPISWPPKVLKYFSVGIFEYILASMLNVSTESIVYHYMQKLMPSKNIDNHKINDTSDLAVDRDMIRVSIYYVTRTTASFIM